MYMQSFTITLEISVLEKAALSSVQIQLAIEQKGKYKYNTYIYDESIIYGVYRKRK